MAKASAYGFGMRYESHGSLVESMAPNQTRVVATEHRIHLSTSFTGRPPNIQRGFRNALAVVTEMGIPDLFIATTCNPERTEIQTRASITKEPRNSVSSEAVHVQEVVQDNLEEETPGVGAVWC